MSSPLTRRCPKAGASQNILRFPISRIISKLASKVPALPIKENEEIEREEVGSKYGRLHIGKMPYTRHRVQYRQVMHQGNWYRAGRWSQIWIQTRYVERLAGIRAATSLHTPALFIQVGEMSFNVRPITRS